jgi:excisionase family DNA binding protein
MTEDAMGTSESLVTFVTHTNAASFCGRRGMFGIQEFQRLGAPRSRVWRPVGASAKFPGYHPSMGFSELVNLGCGDTSEDGAHMTFEPLSEPGLDLCAAADKFLTAEEAAAYLGGLNSRTVTRWAREGYLPAYPIGEGKRRLWRFLETDLEQWMLSRRTGQISIDLQACADTLWTATDAPTEDKIQ